MTAADEQKLGRDPQLAAILDLIDARDVSAARSASPLIGAWHGCATLGVERFEMRVEISGTPSTPSTRVAITELGIDAEARNVTAGDGPLRFTLTWQDEALPFGLVRAGSWLVGEGRYRGRSFQVVLRREGSG